jgi:hypothetical protein
LCSSRLGIATSPLLARRSSASAASAVAGQTQLAPDDLDDKIFQARVSGRSPREIARQFQITLAVVDHALDRAGRRRSPSACGRGRSPFETGTAVSLVQLLLPTR